MEVSGKLGVQDSNLVCLQCERDGLKEPAYGFCKDCDEHLCETCYKTHRRPSSLRHHVLVDKDSMPKIQRKLSATHDDTTHYCNSHKDKALEFYCNTHKSVACYVCVTLEHKQCKVDYIPDVSGNMSDEMNTMFERIESLIKKCKSSIEHTDQAAQNLKQSYQKVVEDIKSFRKEINDCLDQMEAKITREADAILEKSKSKQETVITNCKEITKELEHSKSLLNKLSEENKCNQLFIEMKNAEKRLPLLENKEKHDLDANKTEDSIKFTQNTRIIEELKTNFGKLTHIVPSPSRTIDIQYTSTIHVKSQSEKEECNITGMVMITSSKMIVADLNNESIKMVDVEKGSVIAEMKMSTPPSDVITIPGNKLAVTLRDEKCIQIMSYTETGFSFCHRISVGESCNGVAYCNDKFVVSCYTSRKVVILNLNGEILNVIDLPNIFKGPMRVVISNDDKYLFISDTDGISKNKVVKIDWEGKVKNVFEEPGYRFPYGIQQLEDDTLLVCYRDSNTLLRLSSSLKRYDIVGLNDADLYTPKAVTYCDRNKKLYVSCSSQKGMLNADIVKAFNIKWII